MAGFSSPCISPLANPCIKSLAGDKQDHWLCHSSPASSMSGMKCLVSVSIEFPYIALEIRVLETVGAWPFCVNASSVFVLCWESVVCVWRQISPYPMVEVYILRLLRYTHTHTHTFNCVHVWACTPSFHGNHRERALFTMEATCVAAVAEVWITLWVTSTKWACVDF